MWKCAANRTALATAVVAFAVTMLFGVSTAHALCVTLATANSGSATFSASAQSFSVSAKVIRTGVIVPPPPTPNFCAAGANVNVSNVTFSSSAFTGPVTSTSGGGVAGLHSATATIAANTPAGTYDIRARYSGSTNNEPTSAATEIVGTLTILPRGSTTVISSATPNPTTFGQPVVLSAAVSSTSGTPTGTVTFFNGASNLGATTLSGGVASLSVSTLPVGTHSNITASYGGSGNHNASLSSSISRTVNQANQTISFTAPSTQTFGGGTVALTATASSGLAVSYASTSPAVCTVSGSTVTLVGAGACAITASQAGDSSYNPAPDVARTFAVALAAQVISFTDPGAQTFAPGGSVALSATGGASGNSVTFTSSTASVCTVSGSTVSMVSAGTCTITANQLGNTNYAAATAVPRTFAINPATTTTTLTSSISSSLVGQPVTFSAAVAPTTATGSVTFYDGASIIGTSTLSSGVTATSIASLAPGAHSITAVYGGSGGYSGSTSNTLTHTVIANGTIALRVVSSEGDGSFAFASPSTPLTMTLTTSGGVAQSAPISLNTGSYAVTLSLPDGFGLTAIACNDSDSAGTVTSRSASIVLAPAEAVVCTFTVAGSRKRTVEVISRFMSQRNDRLLTNGPDPNRQIDRLIEASGHSPGGSASSASAGEPALAAPSRLGASPNAVFSSAGAFSGKMSGHRDARSFDDRSQSLNGNSDQRSDSPGPAPFTMTGNSESAASLAFSTSLGQWRRFNEDTANRKANDDASLGGPMALGTTALPAAKRQYSPFDIWLEGRFQRFSDDRHNAESDGHFGVFYVGADYILRPWILVGLLAQYDTMHQRSLAPGFGVVGRGWMAGPYATLRISENIFWQSRFAAGRSTNEVSPFLTYTDTFDTKRWLATSALVGRWHFGNWQLQPSASLAFIEDVSFAYTDSLGVSIPGIRASLGQFKAGPQISYRHALSDGTVIEPRIGAELIWNIKASGNVADFGGTLAGPEELRGRLELGLKAQFPNGVSLDLSGSYDGIGSDTFSATGAKATLRVPLN